MLTETGNTISTVNYHSLLPELYRDEKRRNQANALRQACLLYTSTITPPRGDGTRSQGSV